MTRLEEGGEPAFSKDAERSLSIERNGDSQVPGQKANGQPPKIKMGFRQIYVLIALAYMNFWGASCMSLQAPFFPKKAEEKGATPTQYGFVFGIFELAVMLTSPLYGKMIPRITPKVILAAGMVLEGASCAAFGLLDKAPSGTPFIGLAFFVRIIEGCGSAALMTASFTIIASEFPTAVATTFSFLETAFGLGLIVGPTIGGALYEVGGFLLPFVVCGCCLLFGSLLAVMLPTVDRLQSNPPRDLRAFLLDWGTLMSTLAIVTSLLVIGFNVATLEPHLRQFDLKPVILGTIFTITGAIYAFTSPIWGRVCDKGADPYIVTLVGYLFTSTGLIFLGPFPFLPFKATLWMVIVSLVVIGLGLAAKLVSSFVGALRHTIARGFPENLATYGMVSALFATACSMGAFIGPSIGGLLLDTIGYEMGTVVIFAEEILFLVLVLSYIIIQWRRRSSEPSERDPLLRSISRKDTGDLSSSTSFCPNPIH